MALKTPLSRPRARLLPRITTSVVSTLLVKRRRTMARKRPSAVQTMVHPRLSLSSLPSCSLQVSLPRLSSSLNNPLLNPRTTVASRNTSMRLSSPRMDNQDKPRSVRSPISSPRWAWGRRACGCTPPTS